MKTIVFFILVIFMFNSAFAQMNGYQLNAERERCKNIGESAIRFATFRDAGIPSQEIVNAILDTDGLDSDESFSYIQIVGLVYRGEWKGYTPTEAGWVALDSCLKRLGQ